VATRQRVPTSGSSRAKLVTGPPLTLGIQQANFSGTWADMRVSSNVVNARIGDQRHAQETTRR
jgi:hypothetical protein